MGTRALYERHRIKQVIPQFTDWICMLILPSIIRYLPFCIVFYAADALTDETSSSASPSCINAQDETMLRLVNQARMKARRCGDKTFEATQPLTWNCALEQAARRHTRDMITRNFFSHTGSDGSSAAERVTRAGYAWRAVGENIAAGQPTTAEVVQGWLESPQHCANIMNAVFTDMGAAHVDAKNAVPPAPSRYWTQVFGRPR